MGLVDRLAHNSYMRGWKKRNPHKLSAYRKRSRARDQGFAAQVRKMGERYGLTLDQYHALLEKQNEQCAICKGVLVPLGSNTHIDHNHTSKVVRGLLCGNCNRGIGLLQESSIVLTNASTYVARCEE